MDQTLAKKELQELIKREDLKNKTCIDCGNPNPQWASLRCTSFQPRVHLHPDVALKLCSLPLSAMRRYSSRFWCTHQVCFKPLRYVLTSNSDESFVRSVSMDTWQEDQVRRMRVCVIVSYIVLQILIRYTARRECTLPQLHAVICAR